MKLSESGDVSADEAVTITELILIPAVKGVSDMISKEEEILLPMSLEKLTESDWFSIYNQTMEFGYCLYDPQTEWKPEGADSVKSSTIMVKIFSFQQAASILMNWRQSSEHFPIDLTFVDKDDKVKFFSLGPDRIFTRNRAILGRDVRMCHPPSSVHIVEQILNDFRSGTQNSASFWINMHGKFIYIDYYAVRDKEGNYLGTLEFTQDLTRLRELQGEQRLLSYSGK